MHRVYPASKPCIKIRFSSCRRQNYTAAEMAATTLFSTPITHHHHPIFIQQNLSSFGSTRLWQPSSSATTIPTKSPLVLLRASSSTSTVDNHNGEESSSSTTSDSFTDEPQPINSIPLGGCQSCGKAETERGCNGEGRIQGGIATVPGFGWWPIKAYRPCPGFVATGGLYRRQGQSMDEVAGFGSVPRTTSTTAATTTTADAASGAETQSR